MSLNNLADALQTRFEQRGAPNDLDETISLHREALLLWPAPHPDRSTSLNNFANALQTCFKQRGAPNDLDEAISLGRDALLLRPAHHPLYSNLLRDLAIALRIRFDENRLLHHDDITEAISLYERLLDCPSQDPNRSWSLERLPAALKERQALIGDHVDIVEGTDAEGQLVM
jgi:tetratricopeptide (TPR) repeat protein